MMLNKDTARCDNERCERKMKCKRYLDCLPFETYWYNDFNENDCNFYIENGTIKNKTEKWRIDEKDDLRSAGHRPHICPVCGGKGILQSDFYLIGSLSTSISPVTCRTCGGSGIVWGN